MKVVSDGSVTLPGVPLVAKPWRPGEERADLCSFRVGIMPLPDDPWTRGKCGVKLLQYMAAGVPVVCSPVGANAEIVQDGVNGYLARGDDEWVSRIDELLADPARCRELGAAGRRTVEERYSTAAQLDRLLAVLSPM
jgi:glycosyltransferase involved in cell wall biosynthesis